MLRPEEIRTELTSFLEASGLVQGGAARVLWLRRQRHDTALVSDGRGQSWFLKRRGRRLVSGELSLKTETLFYRAVARGGLPLALTEYLPRLVAERGDDLLVYEGLPHHHDLRSAFHKGLAGEAIVGASEQVGKALALLHTPEDPRLLVDFPAVENPAQTFGNLTPEVIGHAPGAYVELVRLLQPVPLLNLKLRELRDGWRADTLIHGDVKVDNVLLPTPGEAAGKPLITDWETAGIGDPGWDCGGYIGSLCYLGVEALGLSAVGESPQAALKQILAASQTFWRSYEDTRAQSRGFDAKAEGARAFQWAGYWLIQRVAMMLALRQSLSAVDLSALYLASQLVLDGRA